jgi:hypothetical protein
MSECTCHYEAPALCKNHGPLLKNVQLGPVMVSFKLLTNGDDEELDALHIIVETLKRLDGDQIARTLDYLTRRYTRRG